MKYTQVRQPIVEGLFYPADPELLKNKITKLLADNKCKRNIGNRLIVPHGGWDYTGEYIALGFNSLPNKVFKRVIIISNVHREFCNNIILPEAEYFNITNKKLKVDLDAIKTIKKIGKKVIISNTPHMEEHGIEVVLPFINYLFPKAKIVPILLGKTIVSLVRNLSDILKEISTEDTLIITTSNFSEYEQLEQSEKLGELGVDLVCNGKMGELVELTRTNKLKTCGAGAISSLILYKDYSSINILKKGLTPQTPLSGGKATFYSTLFFNEA